MILIKSQKYLNNILEECDSSICRCYYNFRTSEYTKVDRLASNLSIALKDKLISTKRKARQW